MEVSLYHTECKKSTLTNYKHLKENCEKDYSVTLRTYIYVKINNWNNTISNAKSYDILKI